MAHPKGGYKNASGERIPGTTSTLAHEMVEAHIKGEPLPENVTEAAQSAFNAYLAWESMTKLKVVEQETQLVSEVHQFGGCPDAIVEINGKLAMCDWKTSNGVYPDYLIQLAAYDILWRPYIIRCREQLELLYKRLLPLVDDKDLEIRVKPYRDTRSNEQNKKMWAMLNDLSKQVVWHGQTLTAEDWKHVLTGSLVGQRAVPGVDGGVVMLGKSTSKMTIEQMTELIEYMYWFGAEQDVEWSSADD